MLSPSSSSVKSNVVSGPGCASTGKTVSISPGEGAGEAEPKASRCGDWSLVAASEINCRDMGGGSSGGSSASGDVKGVDGAV